MLNQLNSNQNQAVSSTEGSILVLAGAGTGKTKVLTSRIIHILQCGLAFPSEILAVTFTNKAASEMKKRIGEVIGEDVNQIWVGTFHSICAKILRKHAELVGLTHDFSIIDDDDQSRLIKQILSDLNIDSKQFLPKNYLAKISRLKDAGKTSVNFEDVNLPKLKEVFDIYQSSLRKMNYADFGDLILLNLELFKNSPETLQYYQNHFRYILVDEYQDTNDSQYQWLLKLSQLYLNICCVGDDDQSIYSWRGANIANILRFEKDFNDAKIIRLEQNYRSTSRILRIANNVISQNKERHKKQLWSELGEGDKVQVNCFADDRSEAQKIAKTIKNEIANKKILPSQIAILVRAGYLTRQFEESLMQQAIPYVVIGGMKFYDRLEIKDSIAYLRFCSNLADDLALLRIINVPKRGVGEASIENLRNISKQENISLFMAIKKSLENGLVKGKAKENLGFLVAVIEKNHQNLNQISLRQFASNLLNEVGYIQMWRAENNFEAQGRVENIEEFINSLDDFSDINQFLEYISLVEVKDNKNQNDAINIMTIHSAKGLEFEMVFLPGLEEGIFPSKKSCDEKNGIEEERRLMYVAITRAKKKLSISYAKTRFTFGDFQSSEPSRFIKEIPENEINFENIYNYENNYSSYKKYDDNDDFNQIEEQKNQKYKNNYFANNGRKSDELKPRKLINNLENYKNNFSSSTSFENVKKIIDKSDVLIGARVFHNKFGYGTIEGTDGNRLTINFEKTGIKTIVKEFVSFA